MHEHYDEKYFNWQKRSGEFGGWANLIKFEKYITSDMNVIDFGCGGGYLLNNINCNNKIGIEINDVARKNLENFKIPAYKFVHEVPDNWADCIISNHALEHVPDPLNQITLLKNKLKPGGKIIFAIPCDSVRVKYQPKDINYHLYSWSPMNLGNLFTEAGYNVIESKSLIHKWPPYCEQIVKVFGKNIFHAICRVFGRIKNKWSQVRIVAEKA